MGIKVGTRFVDQRVSPAARICPSCGVLQTHQRTRETQISILAGFPLMVYRDKLVYDCDRCRTRTETNVPRELGARPLSERFAFLFVLIPLFFIFGAYEVVDRVQKALFVRKLEREHRIELEKTLATFDSERTAYVAEVRNGFGVLLERCTKDGPKRYPGDRDVPERTRYLPLPDPPGGAGKSLLVYCVAPKGGAGTVVGGQRETFARALEAQFPDKYVTSLVIVPSGSTVSAFLGEDTEFKKDGWNEHRVVFRFVKEMTLDELSEWTARKGASTRFQERWTLWEEKGGRGK